MAPTNEVAVNRQYHNAVHSLQVACIDLVRHLPPPDNQEEVDNALEAPPPWPRPRVDSVAACQQCADELDQLDAGDREGHVCNHNVTADAQPAVSSASRRTFSNWRRQPNAGVLRNDIKNVDEHFKAFTTALSNFCVLLEQDQYIEYEAHLREWADYRGYIRDRALEAIEMLEAAEQNIRTEQAKTPISSSNSVNITNGNNTPVSIVSTNDMVHFLPDPSTGFYVVSSAPVVPQPTGSSVGMIGNGATYTHLNGMIPSATTGGGLPLAAPMGINPIRGPFSSAPPLSVNPPVGTLCSSSSLVAHATTGNPSFVPSSGGPASAAPMGVNPQLFPGQIQYMSMDMQLAIASMNSISDSIDNDLQSLEQELSTGDGLRDSFFADLKEYCSDIEKRVRKDFKEAGENLARLDVGNSMNVVNILTSNTRVYLERIRALQGQVRRARSTGAPEPLERMSSVTSVSSGYKPYMKRLEPPTFSGKVEDWPEFRSIWKELLSDYPDSIQVNHMKANIPVADAKRVGGVKTMAEMWTRLEKIYGDVDLNIITIKNNLESLAPEANVDYKRIMEVYEAIEVAVTQLTHLEALHCLREDIGLMNKLIKKLPANSQTLYTQYITSTAAKADTSSRWDKFWGWMQQLHDSAVQANLIDMCDKGSSSKGNSSSVVKSGITCNTCGGRGHYARGCPSSKSQPISSVKVNVAVAKITNRDEYRKHLPDTKKQIGDCPACKQGPHMYSRNFPFGKADWPSNRLESCPQFISKSPRERGELLEQIKGCYKCTSWKHLGDACFSKNKSNCTVVSAGSACAGVHHKLLHGSGVAFCHKIAVQIANTASVDSRSDTIDDDVMGMPDMSQPVLLEVQEIKVNGVLSKVMWDNGSTAALVTHQFADKAGLQGEVVEFWLVVVGHERVLRKTILYNLTMVDNNGQSHQVQAFGIEQISEDSRAVDLHGVKTVFPGAPAEVYNRPQGPIDILIGSMFRNLQPFGGEGSFTRGRLRLVRSHFGCGYILTGTHPSISVNENIVASYAKTLVNGATLLKDGDLQSDPPIPVVSCNRTTVTLKIPEFFEAEELGVAPAKPVTSQLLVCDSARKSSSENVVWAKLMLFESSHFWRRMFAFLLFIMSAGLFETSAYSSRTALFRKQGKSYKFQADWPVDFECCKHDTDCAQQLCTSLKACYCCIHLDSELVITKGCEAASRRSSEGQAEAPWSTRSCVTLISGVENLSRQRDKVSVGKVVAEIQRLHKSFEGWCFEEIFSARVEQIARQLLFSTLFPESGLASFLSSRDRSSVEIFGVDYNHVLKLHFGDVNIIPILKLQEDYWEIPYNLRCNACAQCHNNGGQNSMDLVACEERTVGREKVVECHYFNSLHVRRHSDSKSCRVNVRQTQEGQVEPPLLKLIALLAISSVGSCQIILSGSNRNIKATFIGCIRICLSTLFRACAVEFLEWLRKKPPPYVKLLTGSTYETSSSDELNAERVEHNYSIPRGLRRTGSSTHMDSCY